MIAEPKYGGCNRLAKIFDISHYSVNRFLERERYEPKDLFEENKSYINLIGGTLSGDDTVIEKLYSNLDKAELIGYYWSGKYKKAIKGINLITLYYTDINEVSIPVNYRNYGLFLADKKELEETNRKDFRELFAIHWGIEVYHRALKQLCNLNNFFVRKTSAICTHIFCSLRAFCQLELMRIYEIVENWYEVQKNLYIEVARKFITENFPRVIVSNYLATREADEEWHRLKLHSFSILSMRNS